MIDAPAMAAAAVSEHVTANDFARRQLAAGLASLATPFHETQRLSVVEAALLPKLDGTHDSKALIAHLAAEVAAGRLQFHRDGKPLTAKKDIAEQAAQHFQANIASLAQKGLLAP